MTTNECLFPEYPRDPSFDVLCHFCCSDENLIPCVGYCQKSFCPKCLEFKERPKFDYLCEYCLRNELCCDICEQSGMYNKDVFKCAFCSFAFHVNCLGCAEEFGVFQVYLPDEFGVKKQIYVCRGCATGKKRCFRCCQTEPLPYAISKQNFCGNCWKNRTREPKFYE